MAKQIEVLASGLLTLISGDISTVVCKSVSKSSGRFTYITPIRTAFTCQFVNDIFCDTSYRSCYIPFLSCSVTLVCLNLLWSKKNKNKTILSPALCLVESCAKKVTFGGRVQLLSWRESLLWDCHSPSLTPWINSNGEPVLFFHTLPDVALFSNSYFLYLWPSK